MFVSNISLSPLPNPCINNHFQPPIYEFNDFKFTKTFSQDNDSSAYAFYNGTINFRLSDIANNYTLYCNWGYRDYEEANKWENDNCVTSNGEVPPADSRILTLLSLDKENLMGNNKSLSSPIKIAQFWYCDIVNVSYPEAYQARAETFLDVTCPSSGLRSKPETCTIKTQLPVRIKAQWLPRGTFYPNTSRLAQTPSPRITSKGLDPRPARDCTDVSFAYPDWFLHDFTYAYPTMADDPETARLNYSITSRATGVRVHCYWGKAFGVTYRDERVGDYYMWPSCDPEGREPDSFQSQTVYTMGYNRDARTLRVQQDWVCGDTSGRYSTKFAAEPKFQTGIGNFPNEQEARIPLYCSGAVCTADPMLIEGRLTKPLYLSPAQLPGPEGANTPSCLFNSDLRAWTWTLEHFLWQTTTLMMHNNGGIWSQPYPYPSNRTLQVQIRNAATGVHASCTFNDVNDSSLDGETSKWWPCYRSQQQDPHQPPMQRIVETHIQFSAKTGQLAINQTWYCNDTQFATPYEITAYGQTPFRGLACGTSNSSWVNAPCPQIPFWGPAGTSCDYTYSAKWCTLGDRDGNGTPLWVASENTTITHLPARELTEPEPDPNIWSCTVSSLGRGPVTWRLGSAPGSLRGYLASTAWFDPSSSSRADTMSTSFYFDLDSSVFHGRPLNANDYRDRDSIIRNVGVRADSITPWVRTYDPARVYDDRTEYWDVENDGWRYYNVLGWKLRLDLLTGYLEVNQSWYCDDKDRGRP